MSDPPVIDAEIVSEEKLPERPREQRSVSLPKAAMETAATVAERLDAVGATGVANRVRAGMAAGVAVGKIVDDLRPAAQAIGGFVDELKVRGIVKMAPRRRAFSPRTKVKP